MPATNTYTPPLGYAFLTPLYDLAIAITTREKIWRKRLVEQLSPRPEEFIIDIGSGTGSLAIATTSASPDVEYIGIDPDKTAVDIARKKAGKAGSQSAFEVGYFENDKPGNGRFADKIVSSLVFHQTPLDMKQEIFNEAYRRLRKGGEIHIADYGLQSHALMRFMFRITVQKLDGKVDTQPNADGILPILMNNAGFKDVKENKRIATLTGTISLYSARK